MDGGLELSWYLDNLNVHIEVYSGVSLDWFFEDPNAGEYISGEGNLTNMRVINRIKKWLSERGY